MSGLRMKFVLGLGGLLALLLLTGGMGLYLLARSDGVVERVLRENYASVAYGQTLKDAIDQLDGSTGDAADAAILRFTEALRREAANVTLPGEREAVADLTLRWDRYLAAFNDLAAGGADQEARRQTLVRPAGLAVKAAAQRIIDLNLDSILSADGEIRRNGAHATRLMALLVGGGALLAVVCTVLFTRAVLGPLRSLTRSAQEIGRGNLDLVVAAPGDDEIGQLAAAFNAMAGHLREARRSDRQSLIRAQHTTQLALDSLPDAVATVTAHGLVDIANHTAQRLFHLRPGMALDSAESTALAACWRQVVDSGQAVRPKGYATAIQVFDGGERFFLPHGLPIKDHDGVAVGVTLVLADITALRRLDEMKSNLVAVVSHELKTPLTGLRMATHLLLDERLGTLSAKQLDLALSARDDAERLHTIVEGLLDISRLEAGRGLLDLRAQDPRALADCAIDAVATAYRDQGVALECAVPARLPAVLADPVRIAHVFTNLLGNALKYTPRGGRVVVAAGARDALVEFTVSDSGAGIPEEHRARIFERFYRVPDQQVDGAGLGLAIAREIVHAHGGELTLDGGDGVGCTFRFTVPCVVE